MLVHILGVVSFKANMQAIPEIGDHTIKKQKRETYTPVPDNILTGALPRSYSVTINARCELSQGETNLPAAVKTTNRILARLMSILLKIRSSMF